MSCIWSRSSSIIVLFRTSRAVASICVLPLLIQYTTWETESMVKAFGSEKCIKRTSSLSYCFSKHISHLRAFVTINGKQVFYPLPILGYRRRLQSVLSLETLVFQIIMYHHHFPSMDGMVEAADTNYTLCNFILHELLDFNWFSVQVIHNAVEIGGTFPAYLRISIHWSPEYQVGDRMV